LKKSGFKKGVKNIVGEQEVMGGSHSKKNSKFWTNLRRTVKTIGGTPTIALKKCVAGQSSPGDALVGPCLARPRKKGVVKKSNFLR